MKVVHISNFDLSGGAAQSSNRIHNALLTQGVDSKYLVQLKSSSSNLVAGYNESIIQKYYSLGRSYYETFHRKIFTYEHLGKFSFGSIGIDITRHKFVLDADIINLHWINNGFISLTSLEKILALNKPVVWTLHDMWAFTGGCHYSGECNKYKTECNICPHLKISNPNDSSNRIFNSKRSFYDNKNLSFITSSNWLRDEAKSSALLKIKEILTVNTPIDIIKYNPADKKQSKSDLKLDPNKLHILFGTWSIKDKRKGFYLLKEAINIISKSNNTQKEIELLVFGRADTTELNLPFKVHSFGRISDEEMISQIYSAADFSVVSSLEDNLPNTVLESLSCGTPVVAFNIGGIPEMIDHKENGYLVEKLTGESLSIGLNWMITNYDLLEKLSVNAYGKVLNNYTYERIGKIYKAKYEEILNEKAR